MPARLHDSYVWEIQAIVKQQHVVYIEILTSVSPISDLIRDSKYNQYTFSYELLNI